MTDLPFPIALALLASALVAGIWAAGVVGVWYGIPVTVAVVAVLAGLYLVSYSRRPHAGAPVVSPEEDEPFADPVEEADRIASGTGAEGDSPAPNSAAPLVAVGEPDLGVSAGRNDPK